MEDSLIMMLSTDSLEQWRVFVLSTWLAAVEGSLMMVLSTDSLGQSINVNPSVLVGVWWQVGLLVKPVVISIIIE